uniref:Ig-like domain-containing protein n=1 Tax=Sphenodon punctatus TaxID=8508 RepID=A0A8D0G7F4_SPHPU
FALAPWLPSGSCLVCVFATGIHTLQLLSKCELRADGRTGGFQQISYDGRDFLYYDLKTQTWVASIPQAVISQRSWNADKLYLQTIKAFLQELCIARWQTFLVYGRESLKPKEPQVLVSDRPTPEGFTRLSCRAHGFYPQDIAVVWLKNGVAMSGETQSWGIVPSGDGTYQTRVTLEIDPSSDARYQCCVEHESLAQELRVALEPKSNLLLIVGAVIAALLLLLVAAMAEIVLLINKCCINLWGRPMCIPLSAGAPNARPGGFFTCSNSLGPCSPEVGGGQRAAIQRPLAP